MMVKWTNNGLLQANDGKILITLIALMMVNARQNGEMSIYTHFTIIDEHFAITNKDFTLISLRWTIVR